MTNYYTTTTTIKTIGYIITPIIFVINQSLLKMLVFLARPLIFIATSTHKNNITASARSDYL